MNLSATVTLGGAAPVPGHQHQVVRPEADQLLQAGGEALPHLLQGARLADRGQARTRQDPLDQTALRENTEIQTNNMLVK